MTTMLKLERVGKSFTLHVQGGVEIPVFERTWKTFSWMRAEMRALTGSSPVGSGKAH